MEKMDLFEKLNKPGIWFVYSDLTQYVYSFPVDARPSAWCSFRSRGDGGTPGAGYKWF